jgi:ABC-type hemin transport system ATPase subunit
MIEMRIVLCGGDGALDTALLAKDQEPFLCSFLELRSGVPSDDIFSRLFRNHDPDQFRVSFQTFDEPTSSMDSWAEQYWLGRFRILTSGSTGLMITLRVTAAMYAEIIHDLDKGRVVESGTYEPK